MGTTQSGLWIVDDTGHNPGCIPGDGVNLVKPLIVFCKKGTKLVEIKKDTWDKSLVVDFLENANHSY